MVQKRDDAHTPVYSCYNGNNKATTATPSHHSNTPPPTRGIRSINQRLSYTKRHTYTYNTTNKHIRLNIRPYGLTPNVRFVPLLLILLVLLHLHHHVHFLLLLILLILLPLLFLLLLLVLARTSQETVDVRAAGQDIYVGVGVAFV